MKKCPNCQSTFDDNMRFCQTDGTPLVDDTPAVEAVETEPAFDPYATIVGTVAPPSAVEDLAAEVVPEIVAEDAEEPVIHQTIGSMPISAPEDVLDLPENDPLRTMYVSESEMQVALGKSEPEPDIVEIPAIEETPAPEPPSFLTPDAPATGFDAPPPSPFAAPDEPMSASPIFEEQPEPAYDDAATMIQPTFEPPPFEPSTPSFDAVPSAFDTPTAAPVAEWTPPPAPDAGWANQEIGSNTPFQPPPAGVAGENKTLAIVSLILGILGLTVCCGALIPSIGAIVTGFMARSKATQDPAQYGGAGLGMAGIITGALGLVGGIIFLIVYFVVGIASLN